MTFYDVKLANPDFALLYHDIKMTFDDITTIYQDIIMSSPDHIILPYCRHYNAIS